MHAQLELGRRAFLDELLRLRRTERDVAAKQSVGDDTEVVVRQRRARDSLTSVSEGMWYPMDQRSTGMPCPFLRSTSGAAIRD